HTDARVRRVLEGSGSPRFRPGGKKGVVRHSRDSRPTHRMGGQGAHRVIKVSVRSATPDDAECLLAIYRPVVLNTAISFELEPPSVPKFRARIESVLATKMAWLVAERDRRPVGYAYATPHRSRGAYQWSVEPSVYV